jgi:hypothetical protein
MVCYARRATGILSIAIVALFLYGADTAHLFDVAGLLISLAVVIGGAAVAAGAVYVALRSVQRKRALAGGCVSCQLQCQHAMTGDGGRRSAGSQRMWLVSRAERRPVAPQPVFVPMPRVPAEQVRVPAEQVRVPAEQVRVPAEQVRMPAERVRVPAGADASARVRGAEAGGCAPHWPDLPARSANPAARSANPPAWSSGASASSAVTSVLPVTSLPRMRPCGQF